MILLGLAILYAIVWGINHIASKISELGDRRVNSITEIPIGCFMLDEEGHIIDAKDYKPRIAPFVPVQDTITGKVQRLPNVVAMGINQPKNPHLN